MKNIICITLYFSFIQVCLGQQFATIKGKVIDEELIALPGIELRINDSTIASTDINGNFQFELGNEVKQITFLGLGFEETPITLNLTCNKLEVIMLYSSTYCFMKPRKVERQRRKRFDSIKSLYALAHKKTYLNIINLVAKLNLFHG